MTTEPKRLRLGSDPLAASVASLQGLAPSDERMAALAARLARAGAPVDEPPSEALPASSRFARAPATAARPRVVHVAKTFGPGILAVVGALVFGGALIVTALSVREAATPLTPPVEAPVAPTGVPLSSEPPGATPLSTAVPMPPSPPRPSSFPSGNSTGAAPLVPNDMTTEPVPSTEAGATAAPANPAPERVPSPPSPTPARQEAHPLAPSTRSRPQAASNGSEGAPLAANTVVESEVELLKQARSALAADPLQAYALGERCRSQYPSGSFSQEREFIAISALVRLGRGTEARSRASLFRMHYPSSAYLPRLARLLGE